MPSLPQNASLDWMLSDEVTQSVMQRDGISEAAIRRLMNDVGATLSVGQIEDAAKRGEKPVREAAVQEC